MKDDIQTLVTRIQAHLSERFEIMANGEPYQVQEAYDLPNWKERTDWSSSTTGHFTPGNSSLPKTATATSSPSVPKDRFPFSITRQTPGHSFVTRWRNSAYVFRSLKMLSCHHTSH